MYGFYGINFPHDVKVLTTKGPRCIRDLTPGDMLYEYWTSQLLEVQEVVKSKIQMIWNIRYNDGRVTFGTASTPIVYGDRIIPLIEAARMGKFPPIDTFAVEYHKEQITEPLFPDAYSTGALLLYGDYDDEYINLPIDGICEPNNFIRFMYNSEIAQVLGKDRIYFSWKHTSEEKCITWKEFFPKYKMFVTSRDSLTPIIPIEYMEASILDRRKLIRGIFDAGFSKNVTPDCVATLNSSEFRLKEVQKILWSLGVTSKIIYNPIMPLSRGMNFRLEITGKYKNYPGFFYSVDNIYRTLGNDNRICPREGEFKFRISKIEKFNQGYTYEVRLNRPGSIYTTANFLPRVGL